MCNIQVLNQIHQQPMLASLSMVSLPAPESVVDLLPTKIHRKEKIFECAEDISEYVPPILFSE